ncbi:MAG: ParB/RepB/Spo0J family partition protein, partial [Eubacteriales bacterium]
MPKKGENISLTSYDDLFETDESRAESQLERVQNIPVRELIPFKNHPFKVLDDEAMLRTTESIAEYGVLTPLIARPLDHGRYEIISGHRRAHAAELAGLSEVPVLVRDMDDDAATVLMVDSNLQRENILPSERAFAYKMKLEAMKHQGERSDLTSCQIGTKLRSDQMVAANSGDSARTVQRYIRLTNLVPDLLDLVDCKQISFNPAVELSYLSP